MRTLSVPRLWCSIQRWASNKVGWSSPVLTQEMGGLFVRREGNLLQLCSLHQIITPTVRFCSWVLPTFTRSARVSLLFVRSAPRLRTNQGLFCRSDTLHQFWFLLFDCSFRCFDTSYDSRVGVKWRTPFTPGVCQWMKNGWSQWVTLPDWGHCSAVIPCTALTLCWMT